MDVPPERSNTLPVGLIVSSVKLHIISPEGFIVSSRRKLHLRKYVLKKPKSPGYSPESQSFLHLSKDLVIERLSSIIFVKLY